MELKTTTSGMTPLSSATNTHQVLTAVVKLASERHQVIHMQLLFRAYKVQVFRAHGGFTKVPESCWGQYRRARFESLQSGLKRPLHEAVKVKPRSHLRPQAVESFQRALLKSWSQHAGAPDYMQKGSKGEDELNAAFIYLFFLGAGAMSHQPPPSGATVTAALTTTPPDCEVESPLSSLSCFHQ